MWCSPANTEKGRPEGRSMSNRLLVHVLFHRHLSQRPSIIALMTADPPFLEPLILNVGLPTLGTHEDAFFVENLPLFFHRALHLRRISEKARSRMAQGTIGLQAGESSPFVLTDLYRQPVVS